MKTLRIADSKFGRVKVYAYDVISPARPDPVTGEMLPEVTRPNLQMACYALGALHEYGLLEDYTHVHMVIVQPFVNHISEYTCTIEELREVERFLSQKAEETRTKPVFQPEFSNCHYCRAKENCTARDEFVLAATLDGFDDIDTATPKKVAKADLGTAYALVPMILDWAKDKAARVYKALLEGEPVYRSDGLRYKLVAGKKGDKEFIDPAEAEKVLKKMRLTDEQLYAPRKLKTPTQLLPLGKAPKVKKGEAPIPPVLGPTQMNRLMALIRQSEGKPTIALETDPKPELSTTDGFDDVGAEPNSDLF